MELGRGADIATVLTAGRLVDLNNDLGYAAEVILDSLTVGAGCTLSELAGRWDVLEESLPALLGRLEAASSQPGLRRRLQYELERRVLNSAQLPDPLSLTLTAAVPFDVRRPSSFVPRQGIDRLLVRLHRGNKELGTIEMPVFGAASAYEIAQEAIDHLGVRTFVRESGADRRPRAWLTGTAISDARTFCEATTPRQFASTGAPGCSHRGPCTPPCADERSVVVVLPAQRGARGARSEGRPIHSHIERTAICPRQLRRYSGV